MKTIQEIFNVVIDNGYYSGKEGMCLALSKAMFQNVITAEERREAQTAIKNYMNVEISSVHEWAYLSSHLQDMELLEENEYDCSHIYRDWANRPTKPKKSKSYWERFQEFFKGKLK